MSAGRLARKAGVSSFLLFLLPGCIVVPVGDLFKEPALQEQVVREGRGEFAESKVAVIDLRGMISTDESRSLLWPRENVVSEFKARLVRAARDDEVRAVVLRISSPGGEVTACDILHHEVAYFREATGKPVVACIQEQGASGAYYVAVAADAILAHPTSVVGSIGVVLQSYDLSGLLAKIGVEVAPFKSGDKKDLNSPFRQVTAEEREILQNLVDDMHERFVGVVAAGRASLDREKVLELADGSVFSGDEAARLQLVDRTGYLDDALEEATRRAGIETPTVVRYSRRAGGGANIYSRAPLQSPPSAEVSLRWSPGERPGARLMYLWQPGI